MYFYHDQEISKEVTHNLHRLLESAEEVGGRLFLGHRYTLENGIIAIRFIFECEDAKMLEQFIHLISLHIQISEWVELPSEELANWLNVNPNTHQPYLITLNQLPFTAISAIFTGLREDGIYNQRLRQKLINGDESTPDPH